MTLYTIKVPKISNGLKRTYNKQLEVYELKQIDSSVPNHDVYIKCKVHKYTKKGWVTKDVNKNTRFINPKINNDIVQNNKDIINDHLFFDNIILAKCSKVFLIDSMKQKYLRAIEELNSHFEKNVPDVTGIINELKQENPEYFL